MIPPLNFDILIVNGRPINWKNLAMSDLDLIIFIELGDTVVELISIRNPAPKSAAEWEVGYTSMAIEVEDMDRAIEYLKTKGVKISREPVVIGTSKRAEIKDPDGLTIELRQW